MNLHGFVDLKTPQETTTYLEKTIWDRKHTQYQIKNDIFHLYDCQFFLQQPSEDDDVLPARPEEPTESGNFFFKNQFSKI